MANQLKELDIHSLNDPTNPMRTDMAEREINELADSISAVGLIEPLIVRQRESGYEVVAGHRRLTACRKLQMSTVPCIVLDGDEENDEVKKLHENSFRADVNPVDEAYWIESIRQKNDMSVSEIARLMHRSEGYVRDRLLILSLPDDIVESLYARQITLGVAHKLGQITDDASRHMHLRFAQSEGVSVRTADAWLRAWQSGEAAHTYEEIKEYQQPDGSVESVVFVPCELCGCDAVVTDTDLVYVHRSCRDSLKAQMMSIQTPPPVEG